MSEFGLSAGDLEALAERTPGLVDVVAALLDRIERRGGRFPARVTLAMTAAVAAALAQLFSARSVTVVGGGRVRLELAAFLRDRGPGAEAAAIAALYAISRRTPRDAAAEARTVGRDLERALVELLAVARTEVTRALLRTERDALASGSGPLIERAVVHGADDAARFVAAVVRSVDAVVEHRESGAEAVRVQVFGARVLGDSKALRRGAELHRAVCEVLLAHDAGTRDAMDDAALPLTASFARDHALGLAGILFDETASSVLCFGPIVYSKRDDGAGRAEAGRFDHVARHARLGESSRILLQQLRGATLEASTARRITVIENLASYLDYVDACVGAGDLEGEIVVCSGGQASLAVVALLRELASHGVPVRHAGDLDRSGVLILRSLAKRSGARITPVFMDAVTHARFVDRGRPITPEERARLDAFVRTDWPGSPGHDLARAVLASGRWIEQEAFFDEILGDLRGA